jgi:hypothetical protein
MHDPKNNSPTRYIAKQPTLIERVACTLLQAAPDLRQQYLPYRQQLFRLNAAN